MEERLEAQSWLRENVAPLLKGCSVWAKRHQHQDNNAGGLQVSNMWSNANQDFGFLVPQLIWFNVGTTCFLRSHFKNSKCRVSETSAAFCLSQAQFSFVSLLAFPDLDMSLIEAILGFRTPMNFPASLEAFSLKQLVLWQLMRRYQLIVFVDSQVLYRQFIHLYRYLRKVAMFAQPSIANLGRFPCR